MGNISFLFVLLVRVGGRGSGGRKGHVPRVGGPVESNSVDL